MKFSVISVGNELIQGRINDTNATYISKKLFEKGFDLVLRIQVPDKEEKIKDAINYAIKRSDVVLITGGLGGTSDDITKEVVASYLKRKLILNNKVLKEIEDFFRRIDKPMPELNKKVAYIIEGSKIHKNKIGFAPCLEIDKDGKKIFLLPGMKEEFEDFVDRIIDSWVSNKNYSKTFKLFGITECDVEKKLEDILGKDVRDYVFYYPSFKGLSVKIISKNDGKFKEITKRFKNEFNDFIYSDNDKEIEVVLGDILRKKGLTISIAESCTGGLISNLITDIPGSSDYFIGGVVVYSNDSKIKILGVEEEMLKKNGAVSEIVALQMAIGCKKLFGTDIGLSTTGIAGPSGGSKEKPVGLVYTGIAIKDKAFVKRYIFKEPRLRIKMNASVAAIFNVVKELR